MSVETASVRILTGHITPEYVLARPLQVAVEESECEFTVKEPLYHIRGYGDTVQEALADFGSVLVDYLESLKDNAAQLDPYMQRKLQYLEEMLVQKS